MKKFAVTRIIIYSIVIVILIAVLVIGLTGERFSMFSKIFSGITGYSYSDSELYSVGNGSVKTDGIKKIDISWVSDSVKLSTHSGNEIIISETNSDKLKEEDKLRYMEKDGVLYIKFYAPRGLFSFSRFSDTKKNLTILIPENYADMLDSLKIDTVSADINIEKVTSQKMKLYTVSGDINQLSETALDNITASSTSGKIKINAKVKHTDLNSTSGDISFNGEADNLKCNSTSGEAEINAIINSGDFNSTSGEIEFTGIADNLNCNSISGRIKLETDNCPSKINAKSVSGKITLAIPDNKGFTVSYSSVSGDFECEYAVSTSNNKAVYGDGSSEFDLSTVSGEMKIKKK